MALMFVCDQTDHRQAARNRVFNSWFTSADDYLITKLDQSICSDDNVSCAYLSIMYHSENDKAHQLENAFVNLSKDIDNK